MTQRFENAAGSIGVPGWARLRAPVFEAGVADLVALCGRPPG
jgi:hypothetical protein